jgi:tRNA threonylcarbamoyladenosine biosynthesis protein TsaE
MNELIHNSSEMDHCTNQVLSTLNGSARATTLGLTGMLGAGKTTFVQSMAKNLGVKEHVTSPTFVIARFYDIPEHPQFRRFVHIDAYRIESSDELRPLRFDELCADPTNLIVVEWPELLGDNFPKEALRFYIDSVDATTRRIYDKK